MANKIQLRRDTTANWTRVNPILDDGEPGLNIDTNQIKYGDGITVWVDLPLASSGNTLIDGSYVVSLNSYGQLVLPEDNDNISYLIGNNVSLQTGYGTTQWSFDNTGRITLPIGWEITDHNGSPIFASVATSGSYNDLSNKPTSITNSTYTWNFNSTGSISLPALLSTAQGNGSIDSNNNLITLNSWDKVDFNNFSGMILVNCHNSGCVTLYLCGGGNGDAVSLGNSKGADTGTLSWNNGISGYTFTATETGDHVFFAIRTRTGA